MRPLRLTRLFLLPLLAFSLLSAGATAARAAAYGVKDDAGFFSADAVAQAQKIIQQIRAGDDRDVLVVTYPAIPDNLQSEFTSKGKNAFYESWAKQIGHDNGVSGIVILMTRNPSHFQIVVGNKTQQRLFTDSDRQELEQQMLSSLKEKDFDGALLNGLRFIKQRIDQHENRAGGAPGAVGGNSTSTPPMAPPYSTPNVVSHRTGFSAGNMMCVGIGILLVVFLIIRSFNRSSGYGPGGPGGMGYGAPPQGGYPPGTYGGNYPAGGYGGGGGGGFGRGVLGGLLGGALGAWGYDKFSRPASGSPNYTPPAGSSGGDFGSSTPVGPDTDFSGGGADFGSAPDTSSSGGGDFGGGGDSSSGGDFGGGGGGGDSGGGGGGGDF